MSETASSKKAWDDWEDSIPDFNSAASSISDISEIITPVSKHPAPNILTKVGIMRSNSSLRPKSSSDLPKIERSNQTTPAEQLMRLIEIPMTVKYLKEIAKKSFMIQYISYYEEQYLIRHLADNVVSGMLLALVKEKITNLTSHYLAESSPQKLKVGEAVLAQTMLAIEKLRAQDNETKIDVQFFNLLNADVMNHAASVLLPAYLKVAKQNISTPPKSVTPTRSEEVTTEIIAQLLDIPTERDKFLILLAKQHCLENFFYCLRYKEVREYSLTATSPIEKQALRKMIKQIGKDFIAVNSQYELNITSKIRNDFETQIKEANIAISLLEPTYKEVLSILLMNTYPLYHKLESSIACVDHWEQKPSDLPRSSSNRSLKLFGTTTSKENSSVNDSIYSLGSKESSISSGPSFLSKGKPSKHESAEDQIASILDSTTKARVLRELADKHIMIHYINFYEKLILLKDLAANGNSPLLLSLIKQILNNIQSDYLRDGAPLRLLMFSPALVQDLVQGCKNFEQENPVGDINLQFLEPVIKANLEIIANALLPKFKLKKLSVAATPSSLTPGSQNLSKLDESIFEVVKQVLENPVHCEKMIAVLAKQHCLENYFYYQKQQEVASYAATATSPIEKQTLKKMIKDVGRDFVFSGAPYELNLSSKVKGDFDEIIKSGNISLSVFEPVTKEVLEMLIRNSYPIYLKLKY